jgi:hypothetical protein
MGQNRLLVIRRLVEFAPAFEVEHFLLAVLDRYVFDFFSEYFKQS